MKEWFEIFKVGTHTASNGSTKEYSKEDCQKIVDNYNTNIANHEAPIVIGHPKDNDPAYGWIERLKFEGEKILAKPKQVVQEFAEAVKQGLFKKRSISLLPGLILRHVGFLGAVPPAVKGLADLKFNDTENLEVYEFQEAETETENIDSLRQKLSEYENQLANFSETTSKLTEYQKDIEKLKTDLNFAETSRTEAEERLTKINLQIRKLEFQQYLNEKLLYGSITPAQSEKVELLLEALDSIDLKEAENKSMVYEFSDGKKLNPVTLMKEFIDLLPKQVPDGQQQNFASKGNQPDASLNEDLARAERIAAAANKN